MVMYLAHWVDYAFGLRLAYGMSRRRSRGQNLEGFGSELGMGMDMLCLGYP